jgi:hypothetical protein
MLTAGQQMVRVDDGMRGQVELVTIPGYELQELRVVYMDRGEKRLAGKREAWQPVTAPPKKLRPEEIQLVAMAADRQLRSLDMNEPLMWWAPQLERVHDGGLVKVIAEYLLARG